MGSVSDLQLFTADTQNGADLISLRIQRGGSLKMSVRQTSEPPESVSFSSVTTIENFNSLLVSWCFSV